MSEYSQELCDQRHKDIEARMTKVEASLSHNLEKLYGKMEEIKDMMLKRLPVWVTAVITILGSICTGLLVALVTHR